MRKHRFPSFFLIFPVALGVALTASGQAKSPAIPRTADGKPDLSGIWQATSSAEADLQDHVASLDMLAGRSVVEGKVIPYLPAALAQRNENFRSRLTADPYSKCYIPGVPRIMYIDYPFQIFQRADLVTMAFEWELDSRLIYLNGTRHPDDDSDSWMGDSRGRWDGDTLVVDVANINGNTWFDKAGDFHSDKLHVVERYRMTDRDTIEYKATLDDPLVYAKPWTIDIVLHRRMDRTRLFEYSCQSEKEEANGAFTREDRTWYPGSPKAPPVAMAASTYDPPAIAPVADFPRMPDGKPDFTGFYENNARGANQGLERLGGGGRGGRGGRRGGAPPAALIVDPPDGKLPMQPWAVAERTSRDSSERGYDDPTAHCFPQGVPRSLYVPQGIQMIQTKDYLVMLYERVSWRIIPLDNRPHLPGDMRLWQGDSVGHWEGDTLVVDTTNLNGKTWLDEGGEIVSYAEHVVERFTPSGKDMIQYTATVNDPVVYDKHWTIAFPIRHEPQFEWRESACHEEDHDMPHLKALKDRAAKKKAEEQTGSR